MNDRKLVERNLQKNGLVNLAAAVAREDDVGGLEVAVHDDGVAVVEVMEGAEDVEEPSEDLIVYVPLTTTLLNMECFAALDLLKPKWLLIQSLDFSGNKRNKI